MPLETATYISDLVTSNPAASDGMNNADDHMRLIKATVKTTFPNITGAITATHTQLNAAALLPTNGVSVLADAGAFFKTNTTDGFTNPAAGEIDFKLSGTVAATFARAGSVNTITWNGPATFTGALTATSITASGAVPIGGMLMWLTDTLPTVGTWCWANGGTLSRTGNGAALFALTGSTYGAGDGSTTFNVIDMQDVVPVGKNTMGGAAGNSLLASISAGIKNILGGLFGNETTTLVTPNLPAYTPAGSVSVTSTDNVEHGGTPQSAVGGGTQNTQTGATFGLLTSTGTLTGTPQGGTSTAFSNLMPARTVNFIIRIG